MFAIHVAFALLLAAGPTPVVLSTDSGCEMDDQWAIAHMALSPSIDLRAIVTAHAPGLTSEDTAKVARDVLSTLPEARRPAVVPGSSEPVRDRRTPNRNAGVDRIRDESKGFHPGNRLTVVVIGPATDVASALLIDPSLADRIKVVAMAFDRWPEGGDPFNVRNDIPAWQVLMESTIPLTVVDGAICSKRLTLSRAAAKAKFACVSPTADRLVAYQAAWLDRQPKLAERISGSPDAWPVWDEGTTAVILGFATVKPRPRPRLRDDTTFDHSRPQGTIDWVTEIDGARLWADLRDKLRPPS